MAVQIYLRETSSDANRRKFDLAFNSAIALGILVANILAYLIVNVYIDGWRVIFYVGASVTSILLICSLVVVQGPRIEMVEIGMIWKSRYRPWLVISVVYQGFNALAGGVAISFFMPAVYDRLGFSKLRFYVYPLVMCIVTVAGCVASIFLLERVGRKLFMFVSTSVMAFTLILLTVLVRFCTNPEDETHFLYGVDILLDVYVFDNVHIVFWSCGLVERGIPSGSSMDWGIRLFQR